MIDVGGRVRDYEVLARLKAGGMATLFLGRKIGAAGFARPVAIKIVHPHLADDQAFIQMFVDEALLSSRITHPNVVHVEELGELDGTYFLVMEYVHGCSLAQLLSALGKRKRRLTIELAVHITIKIAEGLHAAHELIGPDGTHLEVVHRDVSPQNVLMAYGGHVKLIDFGVAKARGRSKQTTSASLKGKISYMAPEQAFGREVDRRTDVYALGIMLWEMLTMRRLFGGGDDFAILERVRNPQVPSAIGLAPEVTPELDAVLLKALAADPKDRPATAKELRRLLVKAVPSAASLESSTLSELLRIVMQDTIEAQHANLPESVSVVLRNEHNLPKRTEAKPTEPEKEEVLHTMTASASEMDVDAPLEASSAPSSKSAPIAVAAPKRTVPIAWLAASVLVALVAVAIAAMFVGGGEDEAVPQVATTPATTVAAPPPEPVGDVEEPHAEPPVVPPVAAPSVPAPVAPAPVEGDVTPDVEVREPPRRAPTKHRQPRPTSADRPVSDRPASGLAGDFDL